MNNHHLLIRSPADGYLGCFQIQAVTDRADVKLCVTIWAPLPWVNTQERRRGAQGRSMLNFDGRHCGGSCSDGSAVRNPPANAGDPGSIPGWGRYPLQYSCLRNPMDRGAGGLQSVGSQRAGQD